MLAQPKESFIHSDAVAFSDDSLGLFDEHSAVEGTLELFVHRRIFSSRAFLEKADRRNIGEGLTDCRVFIAEQACLRAKKIQRPDGVGTKPHRNGMNGLETLGQRCDLKIGVPIGAGSDIAERDDVPISVRVDTGTCSGLTLQHFDDMALFTRGGDNLKITVGVR